MFRLIYASAASPGLGDRDLQAILAEARSRNADAGITGMLLYMEGSFIQLLEGEKPAVEATFGRIEADRRHRGVIVLDTRKAGARVLQDWSMGFHKLSAGDREAESVFALSDQAMQDRLPEDAPREIVRFMRNFSLINRG